MAQAVTYKILFCVLVIIMMAFIMIYYYPLKLVTDGASTSSNEIYSRMTLYTTSNNQTFPKSTQMALISTPGSSLLPTRGYIVALKIYEQQTMASGNLLHLQSWADFLNLFVVQPFTYESAFLTPLNESQHQKMLELKDSFDMEDWNAHTSQVGGYAPMIEWEDFLLTAPRKTILVQMKYPTLNLVKDFLTKGPFPHPPSEEHLYKRGCDFNVVNKAAEHLKRKGFTIVKSVCFNFLSGDELPLKQMVQDIFGRYEPAQVTIILDEWRGVGADNRVLIQENICRENTSYNEYIKPSHKLIFNAQLYIDQYLTQNATTSKSDGYLAVIARFELTGIIRGINSDTDPHAIIPYCLQYTLNDLEKFRNSTGLEKTFLSTDIGKYGSHGFHRRHFYGHLEDMEAFVGKVYKDKLNIREWERTFENVSLSTDGGYIAKLQQVIVTRAKCILFVGGGSFQRHTFHLYKQLHPDPTDRCFKIVKRCTSHYRPIE